MNRDDVMLAIGLIVAVAAVGLVLFIGVEQARTNEDCRATGGTPVKTDRGYECVKGASR